MKECKNRRRKLNNAGMSLIELLVAIAIMAVAISPLLFSFVNVARYNARAREIQQTTALSHTVMENCKAYSYEEIQSQMTNGTFLTGVTAAQTDKQGNVYYMTNVPLENQFYDVSLEFTPRGINGDATTSFDIIDTKSINPYLDAIFTPQGTEFLAVGAGVTAADLDRKAYLSAFQKISDGVKAATEAVLGAGNGVTLTESYIENSFKDSSNLNYNDFKISRNIRILIWNVGSAEQVMVYYDYKYELTNGKYYYKYFDASGNEIIYEWSYAAGTNEVSYGTPIYTNALTNTAEHPTKIEKVYFFYYPAYKGSLSLYPFEEDTITVSNQLADGTRTIDVYLIKQRDPAYSDSSLMTLETSYSTTVTGMYPTGIYAGTNIYHNFDTNIGGGSSTPYNASSWFTSNLNIVPQLVQTENKVLMYDLEFKVYNAGSYDMANHVLKAGAEPVLTMEGTTLDW